MQNAGTVPQSILVGVKFDCQHWHLAMEAAELARKWHARLHFVHVVEPWRGENLAQLLAGEAPPDQPEPSSALLSVLSQTRLATARGHMQELLDSIGSDIRVSSEVVMGPVVETLMREVERQNIDFVLAGRSLASKDLALTKLPASFGLLSQLTVPCLMIPEKSSLSFSKGHIKVLVCDDLTRCSEPALTLARQLCETFDHADTMLLHVNALSEHEFLGALDQALARQEHSELAVGGSDLRGVYRQGVAALTTTLTARVPAACSSWQISIREADDVLAMVDLVADEQNTDVIVIGRHRRFQSQPFGIGNIALAQILQSQKAILVAGASPL